MKRRYLFRGKAELSNEWIIGDLIHSITYDGQCILSNGKMIRVLTNTIGMCLNISTSMGEQIFEDDIVEFDFGHKKEQYLITAGLEVPAPRAILLENIHYNGHEFYGPCKDMVYTEFILMLQDIYGDGIKTDIIGNLYDNPPDILVKAWKEYMYNTYEEDITFTGF